MSRLQRRLRTKRSYFIFYSILLLLSLFPYAILFFFQKQETFKTWHASERPADKKMIMHATIYAELGGGPILGIELEAKQLHVFNY